MDKGVTQGLLCTGTSPELQPSSKNKKIKKDKNTENTAENTVISEQQVTVFSNWKEEKSGSAPVS